MYNIAQEIEREIADLEQERERLILYWFEMGETDHSHTLPPQYPDNYWYMSGYWDREYQLEIGLKPEPISFEHF